MKDEMVIINISEGSVVKKKKRLTISRILILENLYFNTKVLCFSRKHLRKKFSHVL